jgi:hypothetical protein
MRRVKNDFRTVVKRVRVVLVAVHTGSVRSVTGAPPRALPLTRTVRRTLILSPVRTSVSMQISVYIWISDIRHHIQLLVNIVPGFRVV